MSDATIIEVLRQMRRNLNVCYAVNDGDPWAMAKAVALDAAIAALSAPEASGTDDFVMVESAVRSLPPGYAFADAAEHANPAPTTSGTTPANESGAGVQWDDGSPCVKPRPVGMVYPPKPKPRASGYLPDGSGVEWNAYDTAQMEAYARDAVSAYYGADAPLPFSPYLVSEWTGPSMTERRSWTAYTAEQMRAYRLQPSGAGEDAARLDYIERTFSGMTNRERYLPVQMIWGKSCNGRTLREACDKYMKRDADAARRARGESA